MHCDILWNWFERGAVLIFKDVDARIYKQVVIKDLQTGKAKDSANAIPFSLTLKELNTMSTSLIKIEDFQNIDTTRLAVSAPIVGSTLGAPLVLGMTAAETVQETA